MAWRGKRASALYENDDSGEGINAQVNKLRGTVILLSGFFPEKRALKSPFLFEFKALGFTRFLELMFKLEFSREVVAIEKGDYNKFR